MDITTRISTKPAHDAEHHNECSRDHAPVLIRFASSSTDGGFARSEALDCMFFEMEDAAFDSIIGAIETSESLDFVDADYESAREAATDLAERADGMLTGAKVNTRSKIAVA